MDCPAGTKKCGHCREVAIMERWPLVEVQLYIYQTVLNQTIQCLSLNVPKHSDEFS